jgi:phosphopantothenoylcysteine decarboxylase / phosphopantothenate---cysteine ligase
MRVLVAVCGSIAAYRSVDFVRDLRDRGHEVKVVLTRAAREFVSAKVFETFLGEAPLSNDIFDATHSGTDHIAIARWAETLVVYGATAHFLAAYRMGLADDFLQTQLLAFQGEVCVMPAMNPDMWAHPATQENVAVLESRGVRFWGPVAGRVACGEEGVGHLIAHAEALKRFDAMGGLGATSVDSSSHATMKVLISMGPMRSRLDSIRFLQNESSGRMGLELVKVFKKNGVIPRVLMGPVETSVASQVKALVGDKHVLEYADDKDYAALLERETGRCDVFFSAAAVLDLAFSNTLEGKLDRRQLRSPIEWRPVEDFAASFGKRKSDKQWLVTFSAEVEADDRALLERALVKKSDKNADWTLVNRVSEVSGPNTLSSEAWILDPAQNIVYLGESCPKSEIAERLVEAIKKVWGVAAAKPQTSDRLMN